MEIKKAIVPKKNGGNTTVNYGFSSTINNSSGNTNINTENLVVTNLNATTINSDQITASQLTVNNANITNLTSSNITANTITANTSYTTNSYVSNNLKVGNNVEVEHNLTVANEITTKDLNVNNNAIVNYLQTNGASLLGTTLFDILIGNSLTVNNLEVLKSAHFFELIIDKINAAGGSILVTPADGFKVESSYTYNTPKYDILRNSYTLYWQAAEETYQALHSYIGQTLSDAKEGIEGFKPPTTLIQNMWQEGDQAICQEFNAKEGTNYDVSNQYWWRVVREASTEPILLEKTEGEYAFYNWIEVYANDITHELVDDGSTDPKVGDTVAMLGNRHCQDSGATLDVQRRGSAIYLAAYRSVDSGLTPPLFATYKLINDFDLASHRQNKIDAIGTRLKGDFISESGDIIDGKSYRIIPSTNIITSTTNNGTTTVAPSLLQINYLYQDNGQATTSSTVPAGYILGWTTYDLNNTLINSGTITPLDASAISLPNNLDHLELELYTMDGSTKKVRDALSMKVTSLSNLKDGKNGEYTMVIYKDQVKTEPLAPTISSSIHPPTIPNGWTSCMPNVSLETYNIWASTGTVKYDSNNDIIPSNWEPAVQVNGLNGIDGQTGPQGQTGPVGPVGPTGANGLDGITRKLLPLRDTCVIELEYSGTNKLDVTGKFSTDMQYQVIEIDANNNLTTINLSSSENYKISSSFYNSSNQVIKAYKEGNTTIAYTGNWNYPVESNFAFWGWNNSNSYAYLNDNTHYDGNTSYNWLRDINGGAYSNDYRDFYKLITSTNANMISRTPNKMEVKLLYRKTTSAPWETVDSLLYDIVLPSKGIFEHNEYMLRSVLYGSWEVGGNTIYGLSSINQTVDSINTQVTSVTNNLNNNYYTKSEVDQKDSSITSTVTSIQTNLTNNYYTKTQTQSEIKQTADNISLSVMSDVSGINILKCSDFGSNRETYWTLVSNPSGHTTVIRYSPLSDSQYMLEMNMAYNYGSYSNDAFMLSARQSFNENVYLAPGTKIYVSCKYKITPPANFQNNETAVGMDLCGSSISSSITPIGSYRDNEKINNGGISSENRIYTQVYVTNDSDWHTFSGIYSVTQEINLSSIYYTDLFGWHGAGRDISKQPILYVASPVITTDDESISSLLKITGINIEQGKITLNADNTIITGNLTGDDNSAILLQNLRNEPTENLFLHTGEIKSALGISFNNTRSTQVNNTNQKTEYSDDIFTIGSFPANSVLTLENLELDSLVNINTCSSLVQYSINDGTTWNTISVGNSITLSNASTVIIRQRFTYTPSSTGDIFIGGYGVFDIDTNVKNIGQISPRGYVHSDYITYDSAQEQWVHNYDNTSDTHPISRTSFDGLKWITVRNNNGISIEPGTEDFPFGMTINFDDEKILQHYEANYYRSDQSKWIDKKNMSCSVGNIQQVENYISQTGSSTANLFDFNSDVICLNSSCSVLYIDADRFTGINFGKISHVGRRWTILGRNANLKICGKDGTQPSVRIYQSNVANSMSELTIGRHMIELICVGRSTSYIDFIVGFYS